MAIKRRTDRLNSLLREVLSDVIRNQVKNPDLEKCLLTITSVEITKDLRNAKVFVSVIGDDAEKNKALKALYSASGFISHTASRMVVMHHFPSLRFFIDDSVEKQMRIHEVLEKVHQEKSSRDDEKASLDESEDSEDSEDSEVSNDT